MLQELQKESQDCKVPWQGVCTIQRPYTRLCFVLQAVETLAAAGCDMVILSDANTVFIREIIDHHNLSQHFLAVCISISVHPTAGLLTCSCQCQQSPCLVKACEFFMTLLGSQHGLRPCLQPAYRCTPMKLYGRKAL